MTETARIAKNGAAQPSVATRRTKVAARNGDRSALQAVIHNLPILAKLRVGRANDECEQEADRVASQVVATPDQAVAAAPITTDIRRKQFC